MLRQWTDYILEKERPLRE